MRHKIFTILGYGRNFILKNKKRERGRKKRYSMIILSANVYLVEVD